MKKEIKKELQQKLVSFATIYLGSLKKKRQQKLNKYLEKEMTAVADYYVRLLTKKQLKKHLSPNQPVEHTASQVLHTAENGDHLQGVQ